MARPPVLLVNPNLMRPPIAPLGLEYVAASLTRHGYAPLLCDLSFAQDWRSTLDEDLASSRATAVLVSVRNIDDAYFASQDFVLEETAEIVRRIMRQTGVPVCLGGVGFSFAPCEVLRYTGATYGIAGDGEEALPQLLDCLAAGGPVASVPGAVFRTDSGNVAAAPRVPCALEHAPAPPRDFVDNPRYFAEGGQLGIETKRGCRQSCVYCVEPVAQGRSVRLRTPSSVAHEFQDLLEQGIDAFHLCDPEFNLPPEHAHAVCAELARTGIAERIRWYTYAYPRPFDVDLARAMVRAGCVGVNFGADHTDEAMLSRLGRSYGPDEIRQTAQACRDAGLAVMFDLLLGAPGETRESLSKAIAFMRGTGVDRVGLSCGVRIYPNTPLAQTVRRQGPLHANPNLHGATEDNDDLLRPVFYVDTGLDGDIHRLVADLVGGDKRFLHADPNELDCNYNYNDNSVLANAIRDGERGAYWDILRRIADRGSGKGDCA